MPKHLPLSLLALLATLAPSAARAGDEPAVQGEESALPYLQALHAKVHRLWADNFLAMATAQLPKEHPVNLLSRVAELELALAMNGDVVEVKVSKPSGSTEFDAAAVDVVKTSTPLAEASETTLSDDGKVHVKWLFARDDRRCSGLSLDRRELAAPDAVRTLVAQGRIAAAITRLQASDDTARAVGLDAFARAWLDANENDNALSVDVAAANAMAGDARGASRLRKAAAAEPTAAVVRGLAALKISICPFIKHLAEKSRGEPPSSARREPSREGMETLPGFPSWDARQRFLWALGEGADGDCLTAAIETAKNRSASRAERVLAIAGLGRSEGDDAKATLKALLDDADATVKAAAILAEARPGAGKGAVFRLTPLLRDKSVAVRAAAAAALVRVGGEDVLPQLFLSAREKDSTIFITLAPELGALSGQASAEMLGRLLRKDDLKIRVAAARALASRRDDHAAKVQATLTSTSNAELQLLAGLALDKEHRATVLAAPVSEGFSASFAALLRGSANLIAGDWMLVHFETMDPNTRAEMLGQWLGRPKTP
jgi:TonB family protein